MNALSRPLQRGTFTRTLLLGVVFASSGFLQSHNFPHEASAKERVSQMVSRRFELRDKSGKQTGLLSPGEEPRSVGLWLTGPSGSVNFGVHGNGTPFAIVSDTPVRNFGLMRLDGSYESPIAVFSGVDDLPHMVWGLDLNLRRRNAFAVRFDMHRRQIDYLGEYFGPHSVHSPGITTRLLEFLGF